MTKDAILEKVIELFSSMSDAEEITADSELIDDLGLSSLDLMFLISNLEDSFQIKVSEKAIRKMVTVEDVVEVIVAMQVQA